MAALPRNADVAAQFEKLADLLELEGAEGFRVVAYRRAAQRMRETAASVAELALAGRAKELPGIGKTIEEKIVQIVEDGWIHALAKREGAIPPDVVLFMRLPGLGPKTAARIWKELGVTTLEELRAAAEGERLRTLAGLGAKTEERVLKALAEAAEAEPVRPLLGHGLPAVLAVVETLRAHPGVDLVSEAGSVRRRRETFRDLDLIATADDPPALTAYFTRLHWVAEVAAHGDTKATVVSNDGLRFDLRVVPPESYGNLLQHFTGSKEHNVALREDAVRRGLSVSEYGIQDVESGEVFRTRDEAAVYERLGYQFVPPELRENAGELDAARRGELPALVELADLRGDLHCHTTWSADGKGTLEEMALAARARGYDFLAVTDHSHYLREGRMEAQWEEIEALRERVAPLRLLRGVEVNIKADGTLDVADDVLAQLDWVVASLHTAFDRDPTERILAAMDNPHVDCIGHPTARKINRRGPTDLALERVFERAVATGTALELNSQPDRLDLRDAHARAAGEAGVPVVVSSDAHSVRALGYVELGVAQARRAWLTRAHVLNARPWDEVRELLRR
ncbi:MAG TPA: DNA polymerase/3'-5' exonuclease PolX [Gaiellaceae bacterium]|nr:DNA polymerase/3'-5' exonuclease PolX [Gaiellaceae bacterium]